MSYKALDKHKIPCSNLTLPTIKLSKKKKKKKTPEVKYPQFHFFLQPFFFLKTIQQKSILYKFAFTSVAHMNSNESRSTQFFHNYYCRIL
jgi:hypothetical protein